MSNMSYDEAQAILYPYLKQNDQLLPMEELEGEVLYRRKDHYPYRVLWDDRKASRGRRVAGRESRRV